MSRIRKNPQKLLAESLKAAKKVAKDGILKSSDLDKQYRVELVRTNWLTEIIRGWYLLTSPEGRGESTAWFGSFWAFTSRYLSDRFGKNGFCASAESSLSLHAGDATIPKQIIVLTKKASNTTITLPHDTSICLVTDLKNFPRETENYNGLRIMTLPASLCRLTPAYFRNSPENVEIVLKLSSLSVAELSRTLLKTEAIVSAERIIGAYKHFGESKKAKQINEDLTSAGYRLKEVNPFMEYEPQFGSFRSESPYAGRIRLMWNSMRDFVIDAMPDAPGVEESNQKIVSNIKEKYTEDAYHSLSIEGYQVTEELIEKIISGEWAPENDETDKKQRDAMAAKGYQNAFLAVLKSVDKVLNGENSGQVLEDDLQTWYRELFVPLLQANLLTAEDIVGYRNRPVYINKSRHVPPPASAVLDCMEALFDLLKKEKHAVVRAVLGHFVFVFIHPYMDGNGRVGRFLMNLMLISGGFNWTVIRVEGRDEYMASLEQASTERDIEPFVLFIKKEMERNSGNI
jgi:hypothetical protein